MFSRQAMLKHQRRTNQKGQGDVESGSASQIQEYSGSTEEEAKNIEKQTSIFHWKDVCFDVPIKGETRQILDHVDGWVKPGTLTALMVRPSYFARHLYCRLTYFQRASGAGKTTLLDVLACRATTGVVTADMLVDGKLGDEFFQRRTDYVQQQDLHLHSSTVREALNFSALLRQPPRYSREEKLAYVDTVINLLGMEEYSDAIIGVPGEGLNVEQQKRLTIGVELAARPQLLLFLDERTSGLDSQTSWSICNLMEKLTKNGQATVCTIHQPTAMLFQRFDRLLLLSRGRTVYFAEIGTGSGILVNCFTRKGAKPFLHGANPAEYMLEVIGAAPGAQTEINWADVWAASPGRREVRAELDALENQARPIGQEEEVEHASSYEEFSASWREQYLQATRRAFQQYWRNPIYIYTKVVLAVGAVGPGVARTRLLCLILTKRHSRSLSAYPSSTRKTSSAGSVTSYLASSFSSSCSLN